MRSIKEMIGQSVAYVRTFASQIFSPTLDLTSTDYAFWDKLRNGKATGYEIAGVFASTITETFTSWVIGRGVTVQLSTVEDKRMTEKVKHTNKLLKKLLLSIQSEVSSWYNDLLSLGDIFIAVNPDGSFIAIPPNQVDVTYDYLNNNIPLSYTITSVTQNGTILSDTYTKTERTLLVKSGQNIEVLKFPVLIGRIPIVQFSANRDINSLRGKPIVYTLLYLFREFDEIMRKALQGTKVSGNPIPVFENLENPDEAIELNRSIDNETYTDKDGNETDRVTLNFDSSTAVVLGVGGRFNFAAPPVGFTNDIVSILNKIKELIRDKMHTPIQMWGGSLIESGEGAKVQIPAWVRFIETLRDVFAGQAFDKDLGLDAKGGLHELFYIWLLVRKLIDSKVFVGPTVIRWTDLSEGDERTKFEKIKWIHSRGGMSTKESLSLLNLVEDVEATYEEGQIDAAERMVEPSDDFGGTGNTSTNPTGDGSPDERSGNGADSPRMPAFAGGGK